MFERLRPLSVSAVLALASTSAAYAVELTKTEYIAQALSAAPVAVRANAAVVRPQKDGSMQQLRAGSNGFTCLIMGTDKMCADANSMEFLHAMMSHKPPPNKVGITYMLAGDIGASNTDPYATGRAANNHWVVTGPHIMVFGPPSKALGYTRAADPPDSRHPYMMWANTPYEHAMIPVK